MSDLSRLLVVTPHSSGAVPADILRQMLGDHFFDTAQRQARLRHLFLDGDPYTDLIYSVPGARFLPAPYSRFVVDLNRLRDDVDDNGVVKRLDFERQPLYPADFSLSAADQESRLSRYWDTFEAQLQREVQGAKLIIVGHSMAPIGPKLGADTGTPRPAICLMPGEEDAPSFPRELWPQLQAACEEAFAPALPPHLDTVRVGVPWQSDTISSAQHAKNGVPAFGIELNSALFMHPPEQGGEPLDAALPALSAAFADFAARALALLN